MYRNEELTLPQLARALGVEPRRLSYHFKTRCGTNFRGYINDLRLRAVCRDLLESPDSSILDLAYKNGFNSKSSFNMLFLKAYGLTPREFRSRGKNSLAGNGGESLPRRDQGRLSAETCQIESRGMTWINRLSPSLFQCIPTSSHPSCLRSRNN